MFDVVIVANGKSIRAGIDKLSNKNSSINNFSKLPKIQTRNKQAKIKNNLLLKGIMKPL